MENYVPIKQHMFCVRFLKIPLHLTHEPTEGWNAYLSLLSPKIWKNHEKISKLGSENRGCPEFKCFDFGRWTLIPTFWHVYIFAKVFRFFFRFREGNDPGFDPLRTLLVNIIFHRIFVIFNFTTSEHWLDTREVDRPDLMAVISRTVLHISYLELAISSCHLCCWMECICDIRFVCNTCRSSIGWWAVVCSHHRFTSLSDAYAILAIHDRRVQSPGSGCPSSPWWQHHVCPDLFSSPPSCIL